MVTKFANKETRMAAKRGKLKRDRLFKQKKYQAAAEWAKQAIAQSSECKIAQDMVGRLRATSQG